MLRRAESPETDRLPVDLGGMRSTGIMAIAYDRLKKQLGISEGDLYVFDTGQQLAFVEEPIRQRFGCDVVILDGGLLDGSAGALAVTRPVVLERAAELAVLETALRRAAGGTGSVVLIGGEAGIGKTSLVRAFAREAAGAARVLVGTCDDLVTPRTLGPTG